MNLPDCTYNGAMVALGIAAGIAVIIAMWIAVCAIGELLEEMEHAQRDAYHRSCGADRRSDNYRQYHQAKTGG